MDGVNIRKSLLDFEKILGVKRRANIDIERHEARAVRHRGHSANQYKGDVMLIQSLNDRIEIRRRHFVFS